MQFIFNLVLTIIKENPITFYTALVSTGILVFIEQSHSWYEYAELADIVAGALVVSCIYLIIKIIIYLAPYARATFIKTMRGIIGIIREIKS